MLSTYLIQDQQRAIFVTHLPDRLKVPRHGSCAPQSRATNRLGHKRRHLPRSNPHKLILHSLPQPRQIRSITLSLPLPPVLIHRVRKSHIVHQHVLIYHPPRSKSTDRQGPQRVPVVTILAANEGRAGEISTLAMVLPRNLERRLHGLAAR